MNSILSVKSVYKTFYSNKNQTKIKALKNINFQLYENETLGIVGESGCGKSTLAKIIVQLEKLTSGEINYKNNILNNLSYSDLIKYKKDIQLVFQDP